MGNMEKIAAHDADCRSCKNFQNLNLSVCVTCPTEIARNLLNTAEQRELLGR